MLATPGGSFPPGVPAARSVRGGVAPAAEARPVTWIAMPPPLGRKQLRWANAGAVRRIARTLKPDVIIERYYNFGGEGIGAAADAGATAVLEVNAPVIDYPSSMKRRIDRALIVEPMRRWRERICARAGSDRDAERRDPAAGHAARKDRRARMGRGHRSLPSGCHGRRPVHAARRHRRRVRRRVPHLARRDPPRRGGAGAARARTPRCRRGLHRRRTGTAAGARRGRRASTA